MPWRLLDGLVYGTSASVRIGVESGLLGGNHKHLDCPSSHAPVRKALRVTPLESRYCYFPRSVRSCGKYAGSVVTHAS
jgi:hypothetical protein